MKTIARPFLPARPPDAPPAPAYFKAGVLDGRARYRQADGSYRLRNDYHFLIGRA